MSDSEVKIEFCKKKCPCCGAPMRKSGSLMMNNPLTEKKLEVDVCICTQCRYRSLGTDSDNDYVSVRGHARRINGNEVRVRAHVRQIKKKL